MGGVFGIDEAIWYMHSTAFDRRAADERAAVYFDRIFRKVFDVFRFGVVGAGQMILATMQFEKARIFGLAQTPCRLKDRVQNGPDVSWRT